MKIETMMRHFREAYRGVRRNKWMSFTAISAVAVSLFIGIFLVFAFNDRYMAAEPDNHRYTAAGPDKHGYMAAEPDNRMVIRVVLSRELTDPQQQELVEQVKKLPGVKNAVFVSKEQGLRQMKEQWGKKGEEVFKGMEGDNNPLPDLILVHPQNPKELQKLKEGLEQLKGVDRVEVGGGLRSH